MKDYSIREFEKILSKNGYKKRKNKGGHTVFENNKGDVVTLPSSKLFIKMTKRLIKEHELRL